MLHQRFIADSSAARESARLQALERYDVLDTAPEGAFDHITRLTKKLFGVPIAIVSFIDGHRQWYKASEGLDVKEVPREQTFCQHVVAGGSSLIVSDAAKHPNFCQHQFVVNNPRIRFYAGIPLKTDDGHSIGVLCIIDTKPREFLPDEVDVMQDLAHIVMGALELRLTANKDSLTGALSRRAFKEEVVYAVTLALRHHHDLSVVAIDLDLFKSVNDTYGHAAGDVMLAKTVQCCVKQLRSTDLIGRLGGEEFAVLLPNTGKADALQLAEKMREAVAYQRVLFQHNVIKLTASFGVASLDYDTRDVDALLERADKALHSAKLAGRNRCVDAHNEDPAKTGAPRRRVLKAGQILFNNRSSTMSCTVRLLSDQGAGLAVSNTAGVPGQFDLVIKSDGFDKPCRVVSRSQTHLDVYFC
jgi:diguanylate cyclase (GGDEF)-like protein